MSSKVTTPGPSSTVQVLPAISIPFMHSRTTVPDSIPPDKLTDVGVRRLGSTLIEISYPSKAGMFATETEVCTLCPTDVNVMLDTETVGVTASTADTEARRAKAPTSASNLAVRNCLFRTNHKSDLVALKDYEAHPNLYGFRLHATPPAPQEHSSVKHGADLRIRQ